MTEGPITGEHVVIHRNGMPWKWVLSTVLGLVVAAGGSYVSLRENDAVLTEKVKTNKTAIEDNKTASEYADGLHSDRLFGHDERFSKMVEALHRIEVRQAESSKMLPRHVRDRMPPVPEHRETP